MPLAHLDLVLSQHAQSPAHILPRLGLRQSESPREQDAVHLILFPDGGLRDLIYACLGSLSLLVTCLPRAIFQGKAAPPDHWQAPLPHSSDHLHYG